MMVCFPIMNPPFKDESSSMMVQIETMIGFVLSCCVSWCSRKFLHLSWVGIASGVVFFSVLALSGWSCTPQGTIQLKMIPTVGQTFRDAKRMTFLMQGKGLKNSPVRTEFDFGDSRAEVPSFAIDPKSDNPWFDIEASLFDEEDNLIAIGISRLPFVSKSVDRGILISRIHAFGWLTLLSDGKRSDVPRALIGHRMVSLPNGQLLVIGGSTEMRGNRGAYEITQADFLRGRLMFYDPQTGLIEFSNATLAIPRAFHTATVMPSGKVIIAGGVGFINNKLSVLNSVEIYNPEDDSLRSGNGLKKVRAFHTATLLGDTEVVMVGGIAVTLDTTKRTLPVGQQTLEVENYIVGDAAETSKISGALRYPVSADGCEPFPSSPDLEPDGRFRHQTSRLSNDLLLVSGGLRVDQNGNRELPKHAILLKRNGNCWKPEKVERGEVFPRYEHTASVIESEGRRWAVILGGRNLDNRPIAEAEIWGDDGRPLANVGRLALPRFGHTTSVLPEQKLLVLGGLGDNLNAQRMAELFSVVPGSVGLTLQPISVPGDGLQIKEEQGRFEAQVAFSTLDPRLVIVGGAQRETVTSPEEAKEKLFTFRGLNSAEFFTPKPRVEP